MLIAVLAVSIAQVAIVLGGALPADTLVRCGQLVCAPHQYCAPEHGRCAPCDAVCESKHHNYDANQCANSCQEYLHDLRYIRRDEGITSEKIRKLELQLSVMTIIVALVLVLLFAIFGVFCCRNGRSYFNKFFAWIRSKLRSPKAKETNNRFTTGMTHQNPHTKSPVAPPKREQRNTGTTGPTLTVPEAGPPTIVIGEQSLSARDLQRNHTPSNEPTACSASNDSNQTPAQAAAASVGNNRLPAEDSTLDYTYDNQGLNLTPSPPATSCHNNSPSPPINPPPRQNRF